MRLKEVNNNISSFSGGKYKTLFLVFKDLFEILFNNKRSPKKPTN